MCFAPEDQMVGGIEEQTKYVPAFRERERCPNKIGWFPFFVGPFKMRAVDTATSHISQLTKTRAQRNAAPLRPVTDARTAGKTRELAERGLRA
jgi:hypothetical protein